MSSEIRQAEEKDGKTPARIIASCKFILKLCKQIKNTAIKEIRAEIMP